MQRPYTVLDHAREETDLIAEFASDVLHGLSASTKSLPCKYIYDDRGSHLFSMIMELPEYYPTRCETEILEANKENICDRVWTRGLNVVELGAGDGKKTKILLEHLIDRRQAFNYAPIDISEGAVKVLTGELKKTMPSLDMHGIVAEYQRGINWLSDNSATSRNLVLFLGSSIGNFSSHEAEGFLVSLRESMGREDHLLVGFDLKKDVKVMKEAYDDSEGITAAFNLNLLERINRELGGEFDSREFRFQSTWDPEAGAIESFLVSSREQEVPIRQLDLSVGFRELEHVHTESSHKFTPDEVVKLAGRAGFDVVENYYDPKRYFLDALLTPA